MYCKKCGTKNEEEQVEFCANCGEKLSQAGDVKQPTETNSTPAQASGAKTDAIHYCPSCNLRFMANYPSGCTECGHELITFSSRDEFQSWKTEHKLQTSQYQRLAARDRHGCLTAYLIVTILGGIIAAIVIPSAVNIIRETAPDFNSGIVIAFVILSLAQAAFAITILMWKKWGFYGFVVTYIAGIIVTVVGGYQVISSIIGGIIGLGLLWWLMTIGTNAWKQLE